ncbi:unnamed protein product [Durusdinium trenchii]|uniref:Zinc ribbon domain-containing protein n=1 Tax=Durusdinium trenchii TaxID=1381693 RepID=A0ABP0SWB8_9DINO
MLASNCSACGNAFAADSNFCRKCGAPREVQAYGAVTTGAMPVTAGAIPVTAGTIRPTVMGRRSALKMLEQFEAEQDAAFQNYCQRIVPCQQLFADVSGASSRYAAKVESEQLVEHEAEVMEKEVFYDCLEHSVWAPEEVPIIALDLQPIEAEEIAFHMIQMVIEAEEKTSTEYGWWALVFCAVIGALSTLKWLRIFMIEGLYGVLGRMIKDEASATQETMSQKCDQQTQATEWIDSYIWQQYEEEKEEMEEEMHNMQAALLEAEEMIGHLQEDVSETTTSPCF